MDNTILFAGYGAALSTIVAGWNFYQWWRSGPRLVGFVATNMIGYGWMVGTDRTYVALNVSNRGNADTTITQVYTERYDNWLDYVFKKRHAKITVSMGSFPGYEVPFKIGPGHEFRSIMNQDARIEQASRTCRLYLCVMHSMADKPFRVRIKPIKPVAV